MHFQSEEYANVGRSMKIMATWDTIFMVISPNIIFYTASTFSKRLVELMACVQAIAEFKNSEHKKKAEDAYWPTMGVNYESGKHHN